LAGLALATYVVGVRRLSSHGQHWSWWRSAAFGGGAAVVVLALCGGLATYAPAMVSAQVGQFLLMLVVAPALLALGAPLSLWVQACRLQADADDTDPVPRVLRGRAAKVLAGPTTGLVLVPALVFLVYRTPFIEASLRGFWLHLLVNVVALVLGSVLLWPVLGADPVPRVRGTVERILPLLAVAASLALLAAQLRYGDRLLAGRWFLELSWRWIDPVADQRRAGDLAAGAVVLLPLLALAVRTPPRPYPPSA
jgi:putative copper resistance protein D